MGLFTNCAAKKDCIENVGLLKLVSIFVQKYAFIIVALSFPAWAECSSQEVQTMMATRKQTSSTLDALKAQNRFMKFSKKQKKFFEFILKEPENFGKYEGFVASIKTIAESTPKDDSHNEFLSNILESFSNTKESQFITEYLNVADMEFEAYKKYFRLYRQRKNNFYLIIKLMIRNLDETYELDAKAYEEISKLFSIAKIEPKKFQGIDKKSILEVIDQEKRENLHNAYMLINHKSSLIKVPSNGDPAFCEKDIRFLNYIIRESVFLNMRFESATFETFGSAEMVKLFISNATEDYNLICTYFLHFLYARKAFYDENGQYIARERQYFLPVKGLFCFLPDGKKMYKYLYLGKFLEFRSFIKYCIQDTYLSLTHDIKLLTDFKGRDPRLESKFEDFYGKLDLLRYHSRDLVSSSINCGIIKSNRIESLDRLIQNLFSKLELETDNLANKLFPEIFTQIVFKDSLKKFFFDNSDRYLTGADYHLQPKRFEDIATLLLERFPVRAPNKLYYETLIIFLKFGFTYNLSSELPVSTLTKDFCTKITYFCKKIEDCFSYTIATSSEDLGKFFDGFFRFFEIPNNKDFSAIRIFAIENLIKDIVSLRDTEMKNQDEYLEIISRVKTILPQIFIFTSEKKIGAISPSNPYEERIKHYGNFISRLKGLLDISDLREEIVLKSGPSSTSTKRPSTTKSNEGSKAKKSRTD